MKYLYPFLVIISTSIVTACTRTGSNTGNSNGNGNNSIATTIYIGANSGNVYAIDAATGKEKWMFPSQGGAIPPRSFVAYSKGTVYVNNEYMLYAVDAATGTEKWRFNTHSLSSITSAPAISGGIVYTCGAGTLFAIDTATGNVKWTQLYAGSIPIAVNNTIYVSSGYNTYAYDAATGVSVQGQQVTPDSGYYNVSFTPPTITNNTFYIAYATNTSKGNIDVYNLITGQRKWELLCGLEMFAHAPVIYGNSLYIAGKFGSLYAVDTATGALRWKIPQVYLNDTNTSIISGFSINKYANYSSVVCSGNIVYIGSQAFDAVTGTSKWSYPGGYGVPAILNNTLFVAGVKGEFYALDATTGTKKWVYSASSPDILSDKPCIVTPDGTIY